MGKSHPIFSNQYLVAEKFAKKYNVIDVITLGCDKNTFPDNVFVHSVGANKNRINALFAFYKILMKLLLRNRYDVVFSHMNDTFAALSSPLFFLLRIRHVFWYAHARKSLKFRIANFFANLVVTSTKESCPSNRAVVIGQGIDPDIFPFNPNRHLKRFSFVYFGRLDPSKKIIEIIEIVNSIRTKFPDVTLTIIGNPSSSKYLDYYSEIQTLTTRSGYSEWISISPSALREDLHQSLNKFGTFVHAFQGSMDKTLVEASFLGLPAVTMNTAFINEFGNWSRTRFKNTDLKCEIISRVEMPYLEEIKEIERRREIANKHSIDIWIDNLLSIFNGDLKLDY